MKIEIFIRWSDLHGLSFDSMEYKTKWIPSNQKRKKNWEWKKKEILRNKTKMKRKIKSPTKSSVSHFYTILFFEKNGKIRFFFFLKFILNSVIVCFFLWTWFVPFAYLFNHFFSYIINYTLYAEDSIYIIHSSRSLQS